MPENQRDNPDADGWLETMLLIRRMEERLLALFSEGRLSGTTHTCLGQEACAVGVMSALDTARDIVVSNHRCHGHFVAYGGPLEALLGEVMGMAGGTGSGIGGSQHIHFRNFYSNGIQGGIVPVAVGMALAEKMAGNGAVTVVFLGDGTLGEGVVYEAFNIASLWQLPVLFVIEANQYAQSTPTALALAGEIADRPRAFGISTVELGVTGPAHVRAAARDLVHVARETCRPGCLILNTYRLGPHSKGDDMRSEAELRAAAERDPLTRMLSACTPAERAVLEGRVRARLNTALAACGTGTRLDGATFLERAEEGRT